MGLYPRVCYNNICSFEIDVAHLPIKLIRLHDFLMLQYFRYQTVEDEIFIRSENTPLHFKPRSITEKY